MLLSTLKVAPHYKEEVLHTNRKPNKLKILIKEANKTYDQYDCLVTDV